MNNETNRALEDLDIIAERDEAAREWMMAEGDEWALEDLDAAASREGM